MFYQSLNEEGGVLSISEWRRGCFINLWTKKGVFYQSLNEEGVFYQSLNEEGGVLLNL